jgi:hypothetical protein
MCLPGLDAFGLAPNTSGRHRFFLCFSIFFLNGPQAGPRDTASLLPLTKTRFLEKTDRVKETPRFLTMLQESRETCQGQWANLELWFSVQFFDVLAI